MSTFKGSTEPSEKTYVVKFVNEFYKTVSKQRVRAFGLYHKCMVKCHKNIRNPDLRKCSTQCQVKLDEYIELEALSEVNAADPLLMYPSEDEWKVQAVQTGRTVPDVKNEFEKGLLRFEGQLQKVVMTLDERLDLWQKEI